MLTTLSACKASLFHVTNVCWMIAPQSFYNINDIICHRSKGILNRIRELCDLQFSSDDANMFLNKLSSYCYHVELLWLLK